ncbi:hypothetical protein [Aliamphritea spongicola]|nr:hypothetical protein [Aliamphritea spongicola]
MQDFLFKVLPLSVLSFVYVWLFQGFGYILATIVTLAIACYLFGVRGLRLLILPPVVSVIFYYLFFGLMGCSSLRQRSLICWPYSDRK